MNNNAVKPFPTSLSLLSLGSSELYVRRRGNSRDRSRNNSRDSSRNNSRDSSRNNSRDSSRNNSRDGSRNNSQDSSRNNTRENSVERKESFHGIYEKLEEWEIPPPLPPRNFTNVYDKRDSPVQYVTANSGVTGMSLDHMFCSRCREGFEAHEKIVNSHGELWHPQCFVCAQCFRPFPEGIFYEFEGRKYCEHDFHVLFAPCCGKCGEFVIGRVIKAMNANWHPGCFRCEECNGELADAGFIKCQGRALCHTCNAHVKAGALGKHICHQCHGVIDDKPLRFRGEVYHPYHFNCTACGIELNSDAREVRSRPGYAANEMNELYCLRCHDKMGIPICGACRRPIEERVVTALGKHWHVEHFVCAKCEKPFLGHRHYEKKGLAYCETHYHQLFGNLCFVCNQVIAGDVFTALNKAWCVHHFACAYCDQKMNQKTKFFEFDLKPACKKCYEKFPQELKKRMRRMYDLNPKRLPA